MKCRRFRDILPIALLVGFSLSAAQEEAHPLCACKRREVGASGSRHDWDGYRKEIRWHYSVAEAMKIARAEGRLVFWYQVSGDLDKEGC